MTFCDNFDSRMKISWNFKKISSGHRKLFKKTSEENQRCARSSLTTYFGSITFWLLFADLRSFLYSMLAINEKWDLLNFFLQKEKNHPTSRRATAHYFRNFCKIWVSGIISMLRRVRSTSRRTPCVHTSGTANENKMLKNCLFFDLLAYRAYSQNIAKIANFSKKKFSRKSSKNSGSDVVFRLSLLLLVIFLSSFNICPKFEKWCSKPRRCL